MITWLQDLQNASIWLQKPSKIVYGMVENELGLKWGQRGLFIVKEEVLMRGACSSTIRDTLHELLPPDPLSLHGLLLPLFLHSLVTPSLVPPQFSDSFPCPSTR